MYQGPWLECFSWKDGKLTVWEGHQSHSSPGKHQVCGTPHREPGGPSVPVLGALVHAHCPLSLDITSREDVRKHLAMGAGFLPR